MTYDSEYYYAVQSFLEDDELCKIFNIIEIAMNRAGYDISNSELSMRLYDNELEDNIEYDMENLLLTQETEYKQSTHYAQYQALLLRFGITLLLLVMMMPKLMTIDLNLIYLIWSWFNEIQCNRS